ncbi:MAG: neutral/alkaline non-lysosomal ceramidase N-terminal domain-containing protein [Verrucomicrobia bacterium]|nr:neutral/alkaline non-lysosomal ceramidase N-terminal domain-containing protein [Verrucomicrobiota bacterium]
MRPSSRHRSSRLRSVLGLASLLALTVTLPAAVPTPWQAGVAARKITPPGPIWLAGYANRSAPSSGVSLDLYAKALTFDDGRGGRVVIVTLDLIRLTVALRQHVEQEAGRRYGLKPQEILLNASHTHSGPEVAPDRMILERVFRQSAKPQDVAAVNAYEVFLKDTVVALIGESLSSLAPATLEFSQARAGFAMNRRRPEPKGGFSNNPNPAGPVDHDVPVLKVSGADRKIRALLFGYACHNTTLGGSLVSGDYAGHAQRDLQLAYPGATALFLTGCGGDQNPYPRANMVPGQQPEDLVQQHGRALANAVHSALAARLRPVQGPLRTAYGSALLHYEPLSREELGTFTPAQYTPEVVERARALTRLLDRGERPAPLPCPIQVLRFGGDLTLVAIAGEVVVDYSLRLKRELRGPAAVWVAGYSNDVFGYLGSRRVLEEGGYEGISANTRILNHPGRFTFDAEEAVIGKAHELLRQTQP